MPGIAMIPRTLLQLISRCSFGGTVADLMLLIGGVKATLSACMTMGRQASVRDAPNARYISVLSLFSLYNADQDTARHLLFLWNHLHKFSENKTDGHNDARYGGAAEHPHDWNYTMLSVTSGGELINEIILYWIGVQNGSTDMANLAPRIDIGIVDPSIAISTAGN